MSNKILWKGWIVKKFMSKKSSHKKLSWKKYYMPNWKGRKTTHKKTVKKLNQKKFVQFERIKFNWSSLTAMEEDTSQNLENKMNWLKQIEICIYFLHYQFLLLTYCIFNLFLSHCFHKSIFTIFIFQGMRLTDEI